MLFFYLWFSFDFLPPFIRVRVCVFIARACVLCTSPSIFVFFSSRRAAYTSLKPRGPAFPPDSSPSFIPFYASHPISVCCVEMEFGPAGKWTAVLMLYFPYFLMKRENHGTVNMAIKGSGRKRRVDGFWERVCIVMYCIWLASSSIVLSFKPENVDRKETNPLLNYDC